MDEAAAWRLVWLMCVDIGRAVCRLSGALTAVCWRVLGELTPWWYGATVQMAWTLFPGRVGPTGATFSTNALGHGRCSVDRRPKSGVLRSATQTTPRQLTSVGYQSHVVALADLLEPASLNMRWLLHSFSLLCMFSTVWSGS
jgi:hypothetical protein